MCRAKSSPHSKSLAGLAAYGISSSIQESKYAQQRDEKEKKKVHKRLL